jgi:hypothetical protein
VPRCIVGGAERNQPLVAEPNVDTGRFYFA